MKPVPADLPLTPRSRSSGLRGRGLGRWRSGEQGWGEWSGATRPVQLVNRTLTSHNCSGHRPPHGSRASLREMGSRRSNARNSARTSADRHSSVSIAATTKVPASRMAADSSIREPSGRDLCRSTDPGWPRAALADHPDTVWTRMDPEFAAAAWNEDSELLAGEQFRITPSGRDLGNAQCVPALRSRSLASVVLGKRSAKSAECWETHRATIGSLLEIGP